MDVLNAIVVLTNFVIIPALSYGSQLALGALGVTLVYGVLRFANFAHGDTMSFGTMLVIFITWWLNSIGVTLGPLPTALLAIPLASIGTIVLLLTVDQAIYRHFRCIRAPSVTFVILSIGIMLTLTGLIRIIIGPGDKRFLDGERFIISSREFKILTGLQEGLAFKTTQAITIFTALIFMGFLFWFLKKTRTGKAMRAYSDNEDLALLSGIDSDRVVRVCWIIVAISAVISGTLYGLDKIYKPLSYSQLLLPVFAAAVVGGMGSPIGAIFGAYLVAFSEIALTYAFKRVGVYLLPETWMPDKLMQLLSTDYKFAISFAILVIVLLFRPTGLFRENTS